jgi:hypothetical protein
MTTVATFDPQILSTSASIAQFLNGDQETGEIFRFAAPASTSTSFYKEQDIGTVINKLYYLFSNFALTVASYLLHAVRLTDLSKKTWVMSRHAMADASAIKTEKIFQEHLLSRSINTHRKDTSDYFLLPPMHTSLDTHPNLNSLNFFHENGMCRGICHWFIYLYFKTQSHFTDSEQHLRAVGKQFEQGAPRQAAFLNSLALPSLYNLLRLEVRRDYSKIEVAGKIPEQIFREIQCRVPGVYGIYTSSHQVVYIKINDNLQYLFDPTKGCIKITSTQIFKNAMEPYFNTHDNTQEILIDNYTQIN